MKQKLLNKLWLRGGMLVAVLCTLFAGQAWGDPVTVSMTSFSYTRGYMTGDSNIYYEAAKGTASTAPGVYDNEIRVYQSGGTFTVTAENNAKINSVTLGSSMGTTVTYTIDEGTASSNQSITANSTITVSDLDCSSVLFTCKGTSKTTRLYVNYLSVTYTPSTPAYAITAQSNNESYGTVSLSGSVITASPASGYTYADPAYTVSPANSATVAQEGNEFTVTPTANTTVTINFEAIPAYTVTLGDDNTELEETTGGAGVELPSRNAVGDYTFAGWSETEVTTETTTAPTIIPAGTYNPTANITLYPVYTKTVAGGGISHETASVTISEYATANEWTSGTRYTSITLDENVTASGKDNGNNSKYYSTSPGTWRHYAGDSGEITITTTNGTLTSATITYTGNTIKYGENNVTSGIAITVSGTSAVFTVSGSSSNSQISAISVNYDVTGGGTTYYWSAPVAAAVETPSISVADNPFLFSTTATITCATDGAAIKYSYDNSTWNDYFSALTITETTTIYAKAIKGDDESTVAQVTATKNLATPTVTVSGDLTLDLDGGTNVSAGTLSAAVTYNDSPVDDATVTWSSSNDAIATIDASGAVTIKTTGEVTFTATYAGNSDYAEATGTKTVTVVDSNAPGTTAENPYTVAQAIDAIDNDGNVTNVYVTGIVSQVDEFINNYHSITYWISEDGTTTSDQFEVYSGKGIGGADFSSIDDIQVGDVVIVKGNIQLHNSSIYEFNYNNQLVSLSRKEAATITVTGGTEQTVDRTNNEDELTLTATANSGATVVFTLDSENTTLTEGTDFDFDDGYLAFYTTKGGTITVKANAPAAGNYKAATEVTITITVIGVKADPTIVVNSTETVAYGNTFIVNDSMIEGGDITVTSSNTAVATVSGLTITPVAVGTTTITVATAEDAEYKAGSETFTLTVTAPEALTTASVVEYVKITNTNDLTDGEYLIVYESGEVAFDGSLTTLDAQGNYISVSISDNTIASNTTIDAATFTIAAIDGGYTIKSASGKYIGRTANSNGFNSSETDAYTNTITFSNGNAVITSSSGPKLQFYATSGQERFRYYTSSQKTIALYKKSAITTTLNAFGYATFCSEYPLDFTGVTDFSAWQITDIDSDNKITFERVTGSVKGGTGLFLVGGNGATVTIPSADSDNELGGNMLEGTLAPMYFDAGKIYGLAGNTFKKNSAGTIRKNKAYIDEGWITPAAGVKAFTLIFEDDATGIHTVETISAEGAEQIFNLAGQRIQKMQKGINIVNGKKILK